jgi:carbamoyltransferase
MARRPDGQRDPTWRNELLETTKRMRILGLGTEGDSGAAIVEYGRILAAVNEERLSRLKLVEGFPRASIESVLTLSGTSTADLDLVLVGGTMELFAPELRPFEGWFAHWERPGLGGLVKRAAGRLSRYRNALPLMERVYYAMLAPSFRRRRRGVEAILRREFGIRCPVAFVDHHTAHVAAAYASSGFHDALVISLDGGGDGLSGMVCAVRNGHLEVLHRVSAFNSLGNYYAYITHLCGFQAMKHEGKVTGLAAHGRPRYVEILRRFIDYEDGTFVNRGGVVFGEAIRALERSLPADVRREDLAASIQAHSEDLTRRFVAYWAGRTGLQSVALAGGIFANVRINEEVHRLRAVSRVHIHPHMGDGGLGVGAAMAALFPGLAPGFMPRDPRPLADAFLGTVITDDDADAALRRHGLTPQSTDDDAAEHVARLLAEGYVVARATGPMEYGPRALGNRSVLYHPTDPSVNDWLNHNLRRTEFMPFAPAVLAEAAPRCFHDTAGAEHAAEFMTITFQCTPWMKRHMPGVVHLDGTARPQLVPQDGGSPGYRAIIEAFERRTGLPGLINTSFNMHEEPIVATAEDAVRAFLAGNLDYLMLGSRLVAHPAGVPRPLEPVIPVQETRRSA